MAKTEETLPVELEPADLMELRYHGERAARLSAQGALLAEQQRAAQRETDAFSLRCSEKYKLGAGDRLDAATGKIHRRLAVVPPRDEEAKA